MATTDTADAESEADEECSRPRFRGCLVCYSAEWAVHAVRRARR